MSEYEMTAETKDAKDVWLVLDTPGVGYGMPLTFNDDGTVDDTGFDMVYALSLKVGTIKQLETAKETGAEGPDDMDLEMMTFILGRDGLEALVKTAQRILSGNLPR